MKPTNLFLVTFISDASLLELVKTTAVDQNFQLVNVADETAVGPSRIVEQKESLGEKLSGQTGKLFEHITQWQPVLMIFDLENTAVPWRRWLPSLKTSPATRRFPILSFGPAEILLAEAKRVGSNFVVSTEQFSQEMPLLIQKYARLPNYQALDLACKDSLPALAIEGIELFNQGQFYKCHDALEEAWRQDHSAGRNLYKGILQIGIAYFQIQRGNYRGALKMLLRVRQWLEPLPDSCRGVNVADLRQNAAQVQKALADLGPDKIDEFDHSLFKPVELFLD